MAKKFTIIEGEVLSSTPVPMALSGDTNDIACRTCGARFMRPIYDITQYGFDCQRDTVYLECEQCHDVHHTTFVVLYSEEE